MAHPVYVLLFTFIFGYAWKCKNIAIDLDLTESGYSQIITFCVPQPKCSFLFFCTVCARDLDDWAILLYLHVAFICNYYDRELITIG